MRLGIRIKLILAFVLVIVGPILNTFIMMAIVINKLNHDPEIVKFNSLNKDFQGVINRVEENYKLIEDYEAFYKVMKPATQEIEGRVRVIDARDELLYDSKKGKSELKDDPLDPDTSIFSLTKYSYSTDIERENKIVGKIIIDYDINLMPADIARKVTYHFRMSYILGLGSIVLFISLFSRSISRSVLVPLRELNIAAESITRGDLDFAIKYKRNNELGRFCRAFDTMRDKLKLSMEKQQASERQRKEMIGVISHDLRTPISSIKGYVEALQDGLARNDDQFQRYLEVIQDKTNRLNGLIDDLFQFSQMELGNLKMDLQIVDSGHMLRDMMDSIALDWQNHDIDIIIKEPLPSFPIRVDIKRIAQVMDNLLQNAVRYVGDKEGGSVEIWAKEKQKSLLVSVKDNGIGIPKEDLSDIFELFYRGEKSRSRYFGGTGLGLTICKNIIEQHGGSIWAESILGEGTTIFFTLPRSHRREII